jgi:hypothetical protein
MSAPVNRTSLADSSGPALAPCTATMLPQVLLDGDDLGFLLPADDVVTLASSKALIPAVDVGSVSCGYLDVEQQRYPVFCLNKALQLQTTLTEKHRVLVVLRDREQTFALACCALTKLTDETYPVYRVPPSMSSRKQPFQEFALINNRALGLSSAGDLLVLLAARGVQLSSTYNTTAIRQGAG